MQTPARVRNFVTLGTNREQLLQRSEKKGIMVPEDGSIGPEPRIYRGQ